MASEGSSNDNYGDDAQALWLIDEIFKVQSAIGEDLMTVRNAVGRGLFSQSHYRRLRDGYGRLQSVQADVRSVANRLLSSLLERQTTDGSVTAVAATTTAAATDYPDMPPLALINYSDMPPLALIDDRNNVPFPTERGPVGKRQTK